MGCRLFVILTAVLSAALYLGTPYFDQTLSDVPWAALHSAKNVVGNVVNEVLGTGDHSKELSNCYESKNNGQSITYCFTHKNPHKNDYLFSYAGCACCVFIFFGVCSNNQLLLLLGFLGKLAVDITWPLMIINEKYDSSSFGLYYMQHITGREAIEIFWFMHIFLKSITFIGIMSHLSTINDKNAARRGVTYNNVP